MEEPFGIGLSEMIGRVCKRRLDNAYDAVSGALRVVLVRAERT